MAESQQGPASKAIHFVFDVANGRHHLSKWVVASLFFFDALLCTAIIWKIPYTEIDWRAYMEQVEQYVNGERDYTVIKGGTGPLVYPAAHVYIYTALYHITGQGRDILLAQKLFAVLYMATLGLVMGCYWKAKVPPYVFPLLVLSKRLHSIFVLRCFNDCFAVFFLWLTIFCLQRRAWTLGSVAYTWGLGIKMTLLLALPAVGIVLLQGRGLAGSLKLAAIMAQVQVAIATPFIQVNFRGYLSRAFEFTRQFLFKWTVNWRFVGEEMFLSRKFALALLSAHVLVLLAFIAARWFRPSGKSLSAVAVSLLQFQSPYKTDQEELAVARRVTPDFVLGTILSANMLGLLFARSLHYQFYAYIAWPTPYLLWRSGVHPVLQYGLWALQEWAWNVYPSTPASSVVVVAAMACTVLSIFVAKDEDGAVDSTAQRSSVKKIS